MFNMYFHRSRDVYFRTRLFLSCEYFNVTVSDIDKKGAFTYIATHYREYAINTETLSESFILFGIFIVALIYDDNIETFIVGLNRFINFHVNWWIIAFSNCACKHTYKRI